MIYMQHLAVRSRTEAAAEALMLMHQDEVLCEYKMNNAIKICMNVEGLFNFQIAGSILEFFFCVNIEVKFSAELLQQRR